MQEALPVLIVGAGPTGLTAAMELSRLGIPVRLVERLAEFSSTSRALAVQARTMELFQQRGLAEEMLRLGNKGKAATLYGDGGVLGRLDLSRIESRFNYILLLAQSETERLLREQVARQGVAIERSTELVAVGEGEGGDGVTAVLQRADGGTEEVRAAYVIAADGAHSLLRHTLQLAFAGRSLAHSYALADLHAEGSLPEDELCLFLSAQGLVAVFPMGNRRFRLIATEAEERQDEADPDLATMQRLYDAGSHLPARLHDMVWSSHFRINSRMLGRLRFGRIFFGGDAAHIHSPAGGQGMNTGIQDMINLCWKLALVCKGLAGEAILDTYEAERLPVIKGIVSTTERATDVFNSDSPTVHRLINHIAPLVLNWSRAQDTGAGLLSETEANYRGSALCGGSGGLGSVRAGDRFPDLRVLQRGGGLPEGLLDLLDPSQFTLLLREDRGAYGEERYKGGSEWPMRVRRIGPDLEDSVSQRRFAAVLGSARWVLVRPDGYIAVAGESDVGAGLTEWAGRWFPNCRGKAVPV